MVSSTDGGSWMGLVVWCTSRKTESRMVCSALNPVRSASGVPPLQSISMLKFWIFEYVVYPADFSLVLT